MEEENKEELQEEKDEQEEVQETSIDESLHNEIDDLKKQMKEKDKVIARLTKQLSSKDEDVGFFGRYSKNERRA